jgi:hypothetical protein
MQSADSHNAVPDMQADILALATKVKAEIGVDYVYLRCAELALENQKLKQACHIYRKSFDKLYEDYHIREQVLAEMVNEAEQNAINLIEPIVFREVNIAHSEAVTATKKSLAKLAASKRHASTNLARNFIKNEWEKHKTSYNNNKSAFARSYVALIANQFKDAKGDPLKITEDTIKEIWLKDPLSASKQGGMPADG